MWIGRNIECKKRLEFVSEDGGKVLAISGYLAPKWDIKRIQTTGRHERNIHLGYQRSVHFVCACHTVINKCHSCSEARSAGLISSSLYPRPLRRERESRASVIMSAEATRVLLRNLNFDFCFRNQAVRPVAHRTGQNHWLIYRELVWC